MTTWPRMRTTCRRATSPTTPPPTLSGSSSVAGGTISIYDNGRLIAPPPWPATAAGLHAGCGALANGSHNFTATVTDVGRTSGQPAASVSLSIQKPGRDLLTCWSPTTSAPTRARS
ncbi:hypothetical protein KIF59_23100 [Enterobacter cloacae subsp. cloacae]|nr:hypothetical protein [Enterobacter cloacae subsp. cloacae]